MSEPLVTNVSDTARWVAVYRARETERRDAVFRDPFARRLAGERGQRIADSLPPGDDIDWAVVARTHAFDRYILREIAEGADLVVNLAAGLDARPFRLGLPATLQWIEVDLPEILDYKEEVLGDAKPACAVERIRLDLSNHDARRGLFRDLLRRASRAIVIAEGLVIFLMADEVSALGRDLAGPPSFHRWIVDIVSPDLLRMMDEQTGSLMRLAGAPYLFAPGEGPAFFERSGWTTMGVRSLLKTAAKIERLPLRLRMVAMLPEGPNPAASRPWSGVCLLGRG